MIDVTIIPLVGFNPFSHMGHAKDLGDMMLRCPGLKYVGLSKKDTYFSFEDKSAILKRQWKMPRLNVWAAKTPGDMVGAVHQTVRPYDESVRLTLVVGHDRLSMAEGLQKSLEAGKIPEMQGLYYDRINIKTPMQDRERHGFSGTMMREAASDADFDTFWNHLGRDIFSENEAKVLLNRVVLGIEKGDIKIHRR